MDAYIYQAALICEGCASALQVNDGPYADGGGEADCPNHCDQCGVFLENPLTSDGYDYVRAALKDALGQDFAREYWEPFYLGSYGTAYVA